MVKKVNLGCGPVGKDDWINIDWGMLAFLHKCALLERLFLKLNFLPKRYNVRWPINLKLRDLRRPLPFDANEVDYIYISHVLEHFKKFEAEKVLGECFRALKKGGSIRIVVPDLRLLLEKYVAGDTEYFKKIDMLTSEKKEEKNMECPLLADILMDTFYPYFYRSRPKGISGLLVSFVRPHCWMYDYESLKHILAQQGFTSIRKLAFRKGDVPDLDALDVFPEMSLYVEAEK